jgi:hypothetical protein
MGTPFHVFATSILTFLLPSTRVLFYNARLETNRMRTVLPLLALMSSSCATYGGGACRAAARDLCEVCPKNDFNKTYCACVDNGTLIQSDFTDGYQAVLGVNDDTDAAMMCSTWLADLDYPGHEGSAQCKQNLEYLSEWESQACSDLGWSSD